jgi:presequence protease
MAVLEPNAKIGKYTIVKTGNLPHLGGEYLELLHQATGARHIHIACPDDNKTFTVVFPTVPQDSTGIAHILEHIVLAGSERFPVRDPFFAMGPRSLSTFMNALTAPDATYYPFSSRNIKDFFNLLEVYLDATFFPKIDYPSYRQEGWRYEFEQMDDPTSPLKYGGVVFNEMKGGMSSPSSVMWREIGKAVFPDLTYANNSGGDPRYIPDLTHQALKAFHARHYHPSNAYFYTYGDMDLEQTLGVIERYVIGRFSRIDPNTEIPDQPRFKAPVRHEAVYPLGPSEEIQKKSQVLLAFLTTFIGNKVDILGLSVLEKVLLSNAASPLRKALIESKIGEALADGTGLQDSYREVVFAAGLKGVNPEDTDKIEALVLDTLRELAREGVDEAMVDATIHRMELESREVSNSGWPYSLKVFFQLLGAYMNNGDAFEALQFDAALKTIQAERAKGGFFEGLIRKYFLDNPHRATIVLKPDQAMTERLEAEERSKLDKIRAAFSDGQVQEIIRESLELKRRQETPEDLSVLPTLELSDIPMVMEDVPHHIKGVEGARVGFFPQPTNGISYLDIQTDIAGMPDRLKDLVPLFSFVVTKMGAGKSSYLEMAARIEASTGGIGAGVGQRTFPNDTAQFKQSFTLSGKALYRNHAAFLGILHDFLTDLKWDKVHLKNLLGQLKAGFEARVVQAGHMFVWYLAENQLGGKASLQERLEGLTQLATLKRLATLDDAGLDGLLADLDAIRAYLFRNANLNICITSEESQLGELETQLGALLRALPAGAAAGESAVLPAKNLAPVARTTAVPVAYDAKIFPTVPYSHPDAPVLLALANLLRSEYLHKEIREKGGAYGGFSATRPENGTFALLSYRDPHIVRTFKVFDGIHAFLSRDLEAEKVKEAILGAAGDVDPLLSPDNKGRVRFFSDLAGYTLEQKSQFKKRLLSVTLEDLRRVAQTYLSGEAALAVISSEEKVKEANIEMGNIFSVAAI